MKKITLKFSVLIVLLLVISFSIASGKEERDAGPVDIGNITGEIISISGDEVKIDRKMSGGLGTEDLKNKVFSVFRKAVPVAHLEFVGADNKSLTLKVIKILEGVALNIGDRVTSEITSLDRRDLEILENPYCELISKTLIAGEGERARWNITPVYTELLGNSYLLTCFGKHGFSGVGFANPFGWGADHSFIYLFDAAGEKKWGFYTERCVFKNFELGLTGGMDFKMNISEEDEPDYKIYGNNLFVNSYEIRADLWVPMKFIKSGGIYFDLDLRTGEEIWRLEDPEDSDAAFYGIIYDNFIDKVSYLYTTEASLYAADLSKGQILWKFDLNNEASGGPIFDEGEGCIYTGDKDGYFYKIDGITGKEIWSMKMGEEIVRIQMDSEKKTLCLFDRKNRISSVDAVSGNILWEYKSEETFTSPEVNQVAGTVIYSFDKGGITILSAGDGNELRRIELKEPVPEYFGKEKQCYCISRKNTLCSVDMEKGRVVWSYEADKDITRILPVKDFIYILDKDNIYAVNMETGKELWKKTGRPNSVYLEVYKAEMDPYNIQNLGKIENEDKLLFIVSDCGFLSIDPLSGLIVSEGEFKSDFKVVVGDPEKFYIASKKDISAVNVKTGEIMWNKNFEDKIVFVASPEDGHVYYADEEYINEQRTINSRSEKLLGLEAGDTYYILDKETGELVNQGREKETFYPYLEIEAMNKVGERKEGPFFYCHGDSLYTFKTSSTGNIERSTP